MSLETKTPHLTPANGGDTLTTALQNPWFFQTGPLASIQLATLMKYANSKGFKEVAIVRDNTALALVKNFRFAPASQSTIGEIIFLWHTIPAASTNQP